MSSKEILQRLRELLKLLEKTPPQEVEVHLEELNLPKKRKKTLKE